MKLFVLAVALMESSAWLPSFSRPSRSAMSVSRGALSMSAAPKPYKPSDYSVAKPDGSKPPLGKIETVKLESDWVREPLVTDMADDTIYISHDSYQLLKFHGSYMQDDREKRKKGAEKAYQFMLRLKMPCGEVPPGLYIMLDDLCEKYGQQDLRATTRQAFQLHGVLKGDLKHVIRTIMDFGGSTIGGCGDISRNVMTTPAPIVDRPEYVHARRWSKVMAELFKPQSSAFSTIWHDGDKVASVEYWKKEAQGEENFDFDAIMRHDNGQGSVIPGCEEPIYGPTYLPRKFKIGVTVPGDNSVDIYINDIGLVVITDDDGKLEGFNVLVGGGMGRTRGNDETFARAASHLGFCHKDDIMELTKAIVATQRDHGNREVRANARMKYLVHTLGIDAFRSLVETYFGKACEPWREMVPWKYSDWMGWHEQGDGRLFLGLNVEQGRVKDFENGPKVKKFLRIMAEKGKQMVLTPSQSVIVQDINPSERAEIESLMVAHEIPTIEEVDPLVRLSIACPALPLCGLAVTEAERAFPGTLAKVRNVLNALEMPREEILIRMTGCPNGCARPYMAELGFVGDGKGTYSLFVGGSPVQEARVNWLYKERAGLDYLEAELEPVLAFWKQSRADDAESFGDFTERVGLDAILEFEKGYTHVHFQPKPKKKKKGAK